jgi:transcriptional regulator with PAS, ATPase and Fis domain
MPFHITDVLDTNALEELFESFTNLTGMVGAVLDLEGNVIISTGWRDICTMYHRVHPETRLRCRESDTALASQLAKGEKYNVYRCKNGLIDVAVPIIVGGVHIGHLFTGQFFFQAPDVEFFREQANQFGFDEKAYLDALSRVPILSEERVRKGADFLCRMAVVIGKMGITKLELLKANRQLERNLAAVRSELGRTARYTFENIVCQSRAMMELIRRAKSIADSPSNVLLLGESGTGKEIFAQAIHNASDRSDGPFVAVNCGAIPKELIQSELFGYEAGAFTGAHRRGRAGKFEVADKGTLFLDEIGDMPLEMQSNLLRVLEDRAVVRVGGTNPARVDVRLIAATHRNLPAEVEKRSFRNDLYYRLSVIALRLAPLRERPEDVFPIAKHHLARLSQKLGKRVNRIHPDALDTLAAHSWPGNIRELVNVIEQAVNMTQGDIILPEHLPESVQSSKPGATLPQPPVFSGGKIAPLAALEKEAIEQAISHCRGNLSKTAKALGIGRNTLYDKIRKYNVQR